MAEEQNIEVQEVTEVDTCKEIDDLRIKFTEDYKKEQNISLIVVIVFVLLMGAGLALAITNPNQLVWIFVGAVVLLLGTYFLKRQLRKTKEAMVRTYVKAYRNKENAYAYSNKHLENLEQEAYAKLDQRYVEEARFIKDIKAVDSNDIVTASLHGYNFISSNAMAFALDNEIIFLGKFIYMQLPFEFEGRTVIYLNNEEGKGPTDLNGLNEVEAKFDARFKVYSSFDEATQKQIFSKAFIKAVNDFSKSDFCTDLVITLNKDSLNIGLSYIEELINVAIKDPYKQEYMDQLKGDVDRSIDVFNSLKVKAKESQEQND